jgi:hypothetical protein
VGGRCWLSVGHLRSTKERLSALRARRKAD